MKKLFPLILALAALSAAAQTATPYIQWSWTAGAPNGGASAVAEIGSLVVQ